MPERRAASIRFRITAVATVVVAAVLVVAGTGLVVVQHRLLLGNLEDAVRQRADAVAATLAGGGPVDPLPGDGDDAFSQVVDSRGEVVAATANLAGAAPVAPPPDDRQAWRRLDVAVDEETFLVLSRRLEQPPGTVLHVGEALDDVGDATRLLALALIGVIPVIVAVLALMVWWLVGRTLRPVEAIRADVDRISGTDTTSRVPVPAGDDEIARLARTMNAMLDRVGQAAERQQRFVADASHELRSPLARVRSELEVDLAHPEPDARTVERRILDETIAMQDLVDDLLDLARSDAGADAGADAGRRQLVDLDDLVAEEVARHGHDERVRVDLGGLSGAQVTGDPARLARAVGNLLDNAYRHAATTVAVTLGERDGRAVLRVADDGPGIPPAEQARVFDRFARLDESRSPSAGGTGLGLAIVRDIVERHGGTVAVDPQHRPGTAIVVQLPLSPPPAPRRTRSPRDRPS